MIVKNPYMLYEKALDGETCSRIIDHGKSKVEKATVDGGPVKENVRKSNIAWLTDPWLYQIVSPYVMDANKASGWNYDVTMYESLQFTCYEPGGYYSWHSDGGSDIHSSYTKEMTNVSAKIGKIRKLSMTLNLTDPNDYEGGDLKFDTGQHNKPQYLEPPEVRTQGSIIVFPSYIPHQITPLTSGTRYSLVLWALGDPFK